MDQVEMPVNNTFKELRQTMCQITDLIETLNDKASDLHARNIKSGDPPEYSPAIENELERIEEELQGLRAELNFNDNME